MKVSILQIICDRVVCFSVFLLQNDIGSQSIFFQHPNRKSIKSDRLSHIKLLKQTTHLGGPTSQFDADHLKLKRIIRQIIKSQGLSSPILPFKLALRTHVVKYEFRVHSTPEELATPQLKAETAQLPFGSNIMIQSPGKSSMLDSTAVKARQQNKTTSSNKQDLNQSSKNSCFLVNENS